MSVERDYRLYVKRYHPCPDPTTGKVTSIDANGNVDLKAIATRYELPAGDARDALDDTRLRRLISVRLGKVEEKFHGTFIDPDSKQRRNSVPGTIAPFHNRLVDELYHSLTPPEPKVTADSVETVDDASFANL